ncbi:hypothetical protein Ciccas_001887 [Cichlidogyrus casuarinus]|uniref:Uncharacterized protein n=1 Tax=Cichlidogyrus casuarinus TaxID=1844966 RepID=A0ABD2QIX4_9PLAT
MTVVFKNRTNNCFICYNLIVRSPNVLQYQKTQCVTKPSPTTPLSFVCQKIDHIALETGFVQAKEDYIAFNCKSIIEGVYYFSYRIVGSTGACSSPNNLLKACQRQGSPLRDNSVFDMTFGYCPNFLFSSITEDPNLIFNKENLFYCLGRWVDNGGNIRAAIAYDTSEYRQRFRCLTTKIDQQSQHNQIYWGMTESADCKSLYDYNTAPIRLTISPTFDPETQISELQSSCRLPVDFAGFWFYPSEYETSVTINATHIFMRRRIDEFAYEDLFFTCKQQQDNRYLMSVIIQGKCEVDYMCMEFLKRDGNIIRFRMSRPFPTYYKDKRSLGVDPYEQRLFREACYWNSFTLNYLEWTYEYFILDPPAPVNCPIQGKFRFVQRGQEEEKYHVLIPGGMTPRPWVQVLCYEYWQNTLEACLDDTKVLKLDMDKCWRLDYAGRPISEYNFFDQYLTCVGYWMEDTKSHLITYDRADPVLRNFRCWIYKRIGLRSYLMSRGRGNRCEKIQTAESSLPHEGASLLLELTDDEYLFDVCPMAYDDAHDENSKLAVLNLYNSASKTLASLPVLFVTLVFIFDAVL